MVPKDEGWSFQEGSWKSLIKSGDLLDIGQIALDKIGVPFGWNPHCLTNYDRLFWDVYNNGLKTPLLLRPWDWPPYTRRGKIGCREDGSRLDSMPAPFYPQEPEYELVIGNMRYCAVYIQGYDSVPCLILKEEEWYLDVEDLWEKYHPIFEGNWYTNPEHKFPSKSAKNFLSR